MRVKNLLGMLFFANINSFSLTLYKGADLHTGLKYWSVEDTYIDASNSDQNFGRDANIVTGPKKIMLIRFGDLVRAIGPYKVSQSELVLKGNFKVGQKLTGSWKILKNWEEGIGSKESNFSIPLERLWNKNIDQEGANWKNRCRGEQWAASHFFNPSNISPLNGIFLDIQEGVATIKGLEKFIQDALECPQNNHGLALQFSEEVEISSSDAIAVTARPKLIVNTTPEKISLSPEVRTYDSKRLVTKKIKLSVSPEIENQFNDWVKSQGYTDKNAWFASCLNTFNDQLMEHSRFSFAPSGATLRLLNSETEAELKLEIKNLQEVYTVEKTIKHLLTHALKLPICSDIKRPLIIDNSEVWRSSNLLYGGILKRGDTRDERFLASSLYLSSEPWYDSLLQTIYLPSTDLLSACEVVEIEKSIHAPSEDWKPGLVMIEACNSWGQILPEAEVQLFKNEKKIGTFKTNLQGCFLLSKEIIQSLSVLDCFYININFKGNSSWSVLNGAAIFELYGRGNQHVAMLSSRFLIPDGPLDSTNLAKGKLVSDSKKSYPAQLISLTQEDSKKVFPCLNKSDKWIELDLGRDRPISQVILEIKDNLLPKFEIRCYGTGQNLEESVIWAREGGGDWTLQNLSQPVKDKEGIWKIEYYGLPIATRYIRIIAKEDKKELNLVNIKVYSPSIEVNKK